MAGLSRIDQLPELVTPPRPSTSGPEPVVASPDTHRDGWLPWILALLTALASSALLAWHLGTPALWRDESATAMAERRSLPHLWEFFDGSEAPLVPYYAVLKVLKHLLEAVFPALGSHPEVLLRLPSAAAMVVACTLLVHWLARAGQPVVAVCSAGVMLLLSGTSRYGQEARPYAMVLMLAVVATILWWHMICARHWWWVPPYALAIAAMIALHTLAGTLLVAHLVAAAILRVPARGLQVEPEGAGDGQGGQGGQGGRIGQGGLAERGWLGRLVRVLRTAAGGSAGALMVSPLTWLAITHGTGAKTKGDLGDTLDVFLRLFNGLAAPGQLASAVLGTLIVALPLIAIATQWSSRESGDLVRLATCWAVVPLAVLLPVALSRPNLIATRYIVFALPAWALLAGLGLVAVTRGAGRLLGQVDHRVVVTVQGVVLAGALVLAGIQQWPSLRNVRSPSGHGENIHALLTVVDQPEYRNLPIEVFPPSEAIQISAAAPAVMDRVINTRDSLTGPLVWSQRVNGTTVIKALKDAPAVIYVLRGNSSMRPPRTWDSCSVVASGRTDLKWSYYVLKPAAATTGQTGCDHL